MQISMYRASVPVFARSLRNLGNVLRKGEAHALARKIEPSLKVHALTDGHALGDAKAALAT